MDNNIEGVYCEHEGFCWKWHFDVNKWKIDIIKSGGPPSIHKPSPSEPPYIVTKQEKSKIAPEKPKKPKKHIDRMNVKCKRCGEGNYIETSMYDDWDGKLHCSECGHEVDRHLYV